MFKLVFVGTILAMAAAHPINQNIIDEIRAKATWRAHDLSTNPLANLSHDKIKSMLGLNLEEQNDNYEYLSPTIVKGGAPASFDARDQWGAWIHPIRDQQSCGSCWAFAGSEALSDRFAIASSGQVDNILSPEDMVECNVANMGCGGGWLGVAWKYLENTGIVTDACLPYTSGRGRSDVCPNACSNGDSWTKYKCTPGSVVKSTTVTDIQNDIYANGPVETGFTVYEDFMNYAGGIYYHVSGAVEGGHAVKIIGWGNDAATGYDYWLVANSWNTNWGEEGFFRIKQGDSGIDDATYGCTPLLSNNYFF